MSRLKSMTHTPLMAKEDYEQKCLCGRWAITVYYISYRWMNGDPVDIQYTTSFDDSERMWVYHNQAKVYTCGGKECIAYWLFSKGLA